MSSSNSSGGRPRRVSVTSASMQERALILQCQEDPPLSYLMIKRQLQEEFGEDIWLRNKNDITRILRKTAMQKEMMKKSNSATAKIPKVQGLSRTGSSHGVEKELFRVFRGDTEYDTNNNVLSVKDDGETAYLNRPKHALKRFGTCSRSSSSLITVSTPI